MKNIRAHQPKKLAILVMVAMVMGCGGGVKMAQAQTVTSAPVTEGLLATMLGLQAKSETEKTVDKITGGFTKGAEKAFAVHVLKWQKIFENQEEENRKKKEAAKQLADIYAKAMDKYYQDEETIANNCRAGLSAGALDAVTNGAIQVGRGIASATLWNLRFSNSKDIKDQIDVFLRGFKGDGDKRAGGLAGALRAVAGKSQDNTGDADHKQFCGANTNGDLSSLVGQSFLTSIDPRAGMIDVPIIVPAEAAKITSKGVTLWKLEDYTTGKPTDAGNLRWIAGYYYCVQQMMVNGEVKVFGDGVDKFKKCMDILSYYSSNPTASPGSIAGKANDYNEDLKSFAPNAITNQSYKNQANIIINNGKECGVSPYQMAKLVYIDCQSMTPGDDRDNCFANVDVFRDYDKHTYTLQSFEK